MIFHGKHIVFCIFQQLRATGPEGGDHSLDDKASKHSVAAVGQIDHGMMTDDVRTPDNVGTSMTEEKLPEEKNK